MSRPSLTPTKSMDDIREVHHTANERRTRSQSPVKNRKSLPPNFFNLTLPSLPYATQDDLRSLSSNSSSGNSGSSGGSSLSIDQIRRLSKSPVSKRLHIKGDNAQYVIPIPFALSLPPKLSPKNAKKSRSRSPSPTRSKSPTKSQSRLIYTGTGYEKLDTSSSDTESEMDNSMNRSMDRSTERSMDRGGRNSTPSTSVVEILSPPQSPSSKKQGPPSVNSNRRKSVKRVIQARQLKADELSIIEEQSGSNNSSRASSIRSKREKEKQMVHPETVEEERGQVSPDRIASSDRIVSLKQIPVPIPVQTPVQIQHTQKGQQQTPIQRDLADQRAPTSRTPVRSNVKIMENGSPQRPKFNKDKELPPIVELKNNVPRVTTEGDIAALKESNFAPNKNQFLQIHKRSFSDESQVSSVSSFSSVGDILSFASRRSNFTPQNLNGRNVSENTFSTIESGDKQESRDDESSDSTLSGSEASWDSVQKSIDLTIPGDSSFEDVEEEEKEEEEEIANATDLTIKKAGHIVEPVEQSEPESEVADYYLQDTTTSSVETEQLQELQEQESETECSSEFDEVSSQETIAFESAVYDSKDSQEPDLYSKALKTDEDNKGQGKGFNFPNNFDNATNNQLTKNRVISNESHKSSKSRFSYYSTVSGQIEIPDLSEASFSEVGSMRKSILSVNGTTFNDLVSDDDTEDATLEPIGFPSQHGRRIVTEQFKHLYDSENSDSDSEPVFSSYSQNIKSKSTTNINSKKFSDLPPLPPVEASQKPQQTLTPMRVMHNRNHSRHSRTRSMGNIQFDLNELIGKKETVNENVKQQEGEVQEGGQRGGQREVQEREVKSTEKKLPEPKEEIQPKPTLESEIELEGEPMKIIVSEPPTRVDYMVDFKDSTKKENQLNRTITPTMNELKHLGNTTTKSASSHSSSSYQSSRSAKLTESTLLSDVESVVIDLTEDKYDVCMIQRQDSTLSYRSTTEMHKGKEVEVVIVEELEDDLESIYSKYGRNWLGRSASTRSDFSSSSSTFSYNSMASTGQLQVKPSMRNREERIGQRLNKTSSRYDSRRIRLPKVQEREEREKIGVQQREEREVREQKEREQYQREKVQKEHQKEQIQREHQKEVQKETQKEQEDQYFDYAKSNSYYDFNTFINQKS